MSGQTMSSGKSKDATGFTDEEPTEAQVLLGVAEYEASLSQAQIYAWLSALMGPEITVIELPIDRQPCVVERLGRLMAEGRFPVGIE